MVVRIVHAKVSGKAAGADTTRVYGTHWDADHTVTGLENVDNTSDANKPISTATQTALNAKQNLDATLTALAAVTTAADKLIYATAADTFSTTDLTATARTVLDDTSTSAMRTTLGVAIGTDVQAYDADLAAVAALATTGLIARTGAGTVSTRSVTAPAAGITVSNSDGVSGNPTLVLANDLSALEGLGSTGIAVRTTTDTWAQRTLQAPAAGITITNPAGVAGDPTLVLANDLLALEGLSSTGIARRTGTDAWSVGTLVTNAELATMAAYTIKGNATGSTAAPTDIDIAALTTKASPATTDYVLLSDQAASGALKKALVSGISGAGAVSSIAGNAGAFTLSNGITNSTNDLRLDTGNLPGVATNSSASAGKLGEEILSYVAVTSGTSLTTATPVSITSISLTAGDWDVSAAFQFDGNAATTVVYWIGCISVTNNGLSSSGGDYSAVFAFGNAPYATLTSTQGPTAFVGPKRVSLSGTTTYYGVAQSGFAISTQRAGCYLRARRIR